MPTATILKICTPFTRNLDFYGAEKVIIEDILVLTPVKPGWEEFTFNPQLPEGVSLKMTVPLVNGKTAKFTI